MTGMCHVKLLYSQYLHSVVDTQGYPEAVVEICVRDVWHVNDKSMFKANVLVHAGTKMPHSGTVSLDGIMGCIYVRAHLVGGIYTDLCWHCLVMGVMWLSLLGTSCEAIMIGGGQGQD